MVSPSTISTTFADVGFKLSKQEIESVDTIVLTISGFTAHPLDKSVITKSMKSVSFITPL